MATNGGARPGAGRKAKAEKFKQPIARAEKRIADKLPYLIDKMFELADGVLVEDINPVTFKASVYREKPDRAALVYLIDRIMGKPVERQEHTGADGGAIGIQFVDYRNNLAQTPGRSTEDSDPSGEG
jgi:hypothetical protein